MQQFTVPQFIDVESKIIGPITTRQFLILLGTAALIGIFYKLFDFTLFLALAIPILGIAVLFAFVKMNGQPFHLFVVSIVRTLRRPNLRIWNNEARLEAIPEITPLVKSDYQPRTKDAFKSSRLADLSLVVDTQGHYQGNNPDQDKRVDKQAEPADNVKPV
ncbi:MAG: PrgI family protein [Candidatus Falkowbacteria bacterium]|nr:PrgI family protein [Candidatus Falkowbacteria bacterium]